MPHMLVQCLCALQFYKEIGCIQNEAEEDMKPVSTSIQYQILRHNDDAIQKFTGKWSIYSQKKKYL